MTASVWRLPFGATEDRNRKAGHSNPTLRVWWS